MNESTKLPKDSCEENKTYGEIDWIYYENQIRDINEDISYREQEKRRFGYSVEKT